MKVGKTLWKIIILKLIVVSLIFWFWRDTNFKNQSLEKQQQHIFNQLTP